MRFLRVFNHWNLLALSLFAITTLGCGPGDIDAANEGASVTVANRVCPIMGGEVTEAGGSVEWNGQSIGFCCDGCDDKWKSLSETEKAEKLAAAKSAGEGEAHHEHRADKDHS